MKKRSNPIRIGVSSACLSLLLVGCATSIERPVEQLARSQSIIDIAKGQHHNANGDLYLQQAEVNLAAARVAANNENYLRATQLAEQAEVEAQLSMAIVKRRDTEQALDEIQKTIRTLRDETTPNGQ